MKNAYESDGVSGLATKETGPIKSQTIPKYLEQRILRPKQKYPT